MTINRQKDGATLTISPVGRLDTTSAPELQDEIANLDGVSELIFDLASLDYLSSAGLRVFLSAQKAMNASGGRMTIRNPNDVVRNVFDITGCTDIFTVV
ncbi:MAG: STAS domain-containing protein [Kiritimatiellae bacterium]|nr:STAS domain-containing protein [Kiritimatiellia bacterium]